MTIEHKCTLLPMAHPMVNPSIIAVIMLICLEGECKHCMCSSVQIIYPFALTRIRYLYAKVENTANLQKIIVRVY